MGYLEYCDSLGFDDRPDYDHLKNLMRDVFVRECHQHDLIFDWMLVQQKRKPLPLRNGDRNGDRKRTRSSQLKKVARKEEEDSNEEEEESESEEEDEDSSKCADSIGGPQN